MRCFDYPHWTIYHILNRVFKEMDLGKRVVDAFFDLSRAFNTMVYGFMVYGISTCLQQ